MQRKTDVVEISADSARLLLALCYEHGYVGSGLKRIAAEWSSAKSEADRKRLGDTLARYAEVMSKSLDDIVVWAESIRFESDHQSAAGDTPATTEV